MKQNEMVMKSTLAALMLAALAAGNLAHAADSGKAEFSADIEAHTALKCGLSVSVTDPEIPMIYRKGTDGQLGEMAYPGAKEHIIDGKMTGPEACVFSQLRLDVTSSLDEIPGGKGFKLASGGYWPLTYMLSDAASSPKREFEYADSTGLRTGKKFEPKKSTVFKHKSTSFNGTVNNQIPTTTTWSAAADQTIVYQVNTPAILSDLAATGQRGVSDFIRIKRQTVAPEALVARSFKYGVTPYHTDHPFNSELEEDDSSVTEGEKLEATTTLTFTAQ